MLRRWILATAVVAATLAGCSSGTHHGSASRASPAGGAAAKGQYLALAAQANSAIDRAKVQLRRDADLASTQTDLRAITAAKRAFDHGLAGLVVPDAARAPVARLLATDAHLEQLLDEGSAATSTGQLDVATPEIIQAGADAVAAADAVRRALGLSPLT